MPAVDDSLTTWETCQAELGVADGDETKVEALIVAASAWLSDYCGRKFESASHTAVYDGHGGDVLYLTEAAPVTAVTSVHLSSSATFDADSLLTATTQYRTVAGDVDPGRLVRVGGTWTEGVGNIQIVYTAGYASDAIPADVDRAAVELVAYLLKVQDKGAYAVTSEALQAGAGSQAFVGRELPSHVRRIVSRYRFEGLW